MDPRTSQSSRLRLVVGIDNPQFKANPAGFTSSDRLDWLVAAFCNVNDIPYKKEFVSISLSLAPFTPPKHPVRSIAHAADSYGVPFVLKPTVIDEIAVVSMGDFQNLVADATIAEIECKSTKPWLRRFVKVAGSREKRIQLLIKAVKKVQARNGYAEARILRPLRKADCVDPEAGRQEVLGDYLLGKDERR
jgi:hypothetical protein